MEHAYLAAGSQLGPYRIETLLGEGGMGLVYRALDTKLNRPVAIKFLSGDIADADARRRFQGEALTASSLNHPHILTVHDVGELDGRQYLVTELVDGGTLTKSFDQRSGYSPYATVDPAFDAVRSDPRFKALVARLNLPN